MARIELAKKNLKSEQMKNDFFFSAKLYAIQKMVEEKIVYTCAAQHTFLFFQSVIRNRFLVFGAMENFNISINNVIL